MTLKHLGQKTKYSYNKPDSKLLERFKNKHPDNVYLVPLTQDRDEFTSLCPVTGQPDYASIEIVYAPNEWCVESKSLKLYLMSYRNHGEFHEDVCNKIMNDLYELLKPRYIRVSGNFASRGGIAIRPIVHKWSDIEPIHIENQITWLVHCWDTKK